MKRLLRILIRWAVVIAYAGIIFHVSSLSQPIPITAFPVAIPPGVDKVIHFFEYAVLCFLLCRAVDVSSSWELTAASTFGANALFICFLCASLYGLTDEIHQRYVPLRSCDGVDLVADAAGAATVAMLWPAVTARLPFLRR